jgi:hypothetical protein
MDVRCSIIQTIRNRTHFARLRAIATTIASSQLIATFSTWWSQPRQRRIMVRSNKTRSRFYRSHQNDATGRRSMFEKKGFCFFFIFLLLFTCFENQFDSSTEMSHNDTTINNEHAATEQYRRRRSRKRRQGLANNRHDQQRRKTAARHAPSSHFARHDLRHYEARHSSTGASRRRQAHCKRLLRGGARRPKGVSRRRIARCIDVRRARQANDSHDDGRRLLAKAARTHTLRLPRRQMTETDDRFECN